MLKCCHSAIKTVHFWCSVNFAVLELASPLRGTNDAGILGDGGRIQKAWLDARNGLWGGGSWQPPNGGGSGRCLTTSKKWMFPLKWRVFGEFSAGFVRA